VPVVSIAEMGTRDVLHEDRGVWIAKEELEDFSGKVIRMLRDDDTRIKLGEAGRIYAREWSAGKLAERMLVFYNSVIESKGHERLRPAYENRTSTSLKIP
jgi:glycosyltransferase involved in cell wall biosynthesis